MQKSANKTGVFWIGVLRLALFAGVLAFPFLLIAGEEKLKPGEWPADWLFRVPVQTTEQAESYDVGFEHGGFAQPDGRDIRVFGPAGDAVSHIVSFADSARARVIFDGAGGVGKYTVYFGNLSSKLPEPPVGISEFGRADWKPKGGFTCTSYDPAVTGPVDGKQLVSLEKMLSYYEKVVQNAQAAEQEASKKVDPKRIKYVLSSIYANADKTIGAPPEYFHIFRAEVQIDTAGKYDFVIANAQSTDRFGVIFVDGERKTAAVSGWYVLGYGGAPLCVTFTGQAEFKVGRHVIEMYTNRRSPQIRMGLAGGSSKVPDYLNGVFADYAIAKKVAAGEIEAPESSFADYCHKAIAGWLAQNHFSSARSICRFLQERFKNDAGKLKQFSSEYVRISDESYERNWLTEGKYATRTHAVADAVFAPPFQATPHPVDSRLDDRTHASGCVWTEGKLIYGLPFNVQDKPWGVTSAVCVEDQVLFVGTKNGAMHAIELSNGSERWSFVSEGECVGAPLVYKGVLYYGTLDRRLYALDIDRGKMIWNYPSKGWIEGGPCASDDRIYFGSLDKTLYAIDSNLGIERWKTPLSGPISATPSTDTKTVYVGTTTGDFFAVDASTGKIIWKYSAGAGINGGACLSKDRVGFGDLAGNVHWLDSSSGKLVWKAPCPVGGPVAASPILVGSALYGGTSDGVVFGIELETGIVGWRENIVGGGDICRSPLFADGKLIFTSKMRGLYGTPAGQPALIEYKPGVSLQPLRQAAEDNVPDGNLTEPSWKHALRLSLRKPNGFAASKNSDVKLLWDAKSLYVGLVCRDAGSAGDNNESVTVLIDPRGDGLVVYQFNLTRGGVASATLLTAIGQDPADPKVKQALAQFKFPAAGPSWTPVWIGKSLNATIPSENSGDEPAAGWTAEMEIPFESLIKAVAPVPQNGARWHINVIRNPGKGAPVLAVVPTKNPNGIGLPAEWQPIQLLAEKVKLQP